MGEDAGERESAWVVLGVVEVPRDVLGLHDPVTLILNEEVGLELREGVTLML